MRIEEALNRYVVQLQADGRSDHTIRQAQRHIRLLASWLVATGKCSSIERVTHEDLAAFLASDAARQRNDGKPRKPTSTNALRSSLRAFFKYVHGAGYAPLNAAVLVRRAICGTPPPKALSEQGQERLLHALAAAKTKAERRDRVLFELLLRTGARIGSILASCVEDVALEAGELYLMREKARRERVLYLPESVVELLREHVGDGGGGYVFSGQGRGPLTVRHVQRRLAGWCERAGIRRVSPHCLRHAFATRIYERTGDVLLVKEALGHRSISSTAVYARAGEQRLRQALGA